MTSATCKNLVKEIFMSTSEIKTYKNCRRQWEFTSRNRMMVKPRITPKALALGTLWHEALASLYSGANYDAVWALVQQEMTENDTALKAMLPQYYEQVLKQDMQDWKVLEVEHKFYFPTGLSRLSDDTAVCPKCDRVFDSNVKALWPQHSEEFPDILGRCMDCNVAIVPQILEVHMTGAIDLIVYDESNDQVLGIEHKTCAKFRDDVFGHLDEQPRVYFEALNHYIENLKGKRNSKGDLIIPKTAINGGIVISETKKLLRDFQHKRTVYSYYALDHAAFLSAWRNELKSCAASIMLDRAEVPTPNYFSCQMCDFKGVCKVYGHAPISKNQLLEDFSLEFEERTVDYLDEKNKLFDSVIPSRKGVD